ncbi:hypothetical protein Rhopal_004900-T1 [Rhodotorula paludigena]|uniref:Uncharacterized protein n=1 Tax=Rhodotorula paludigena TaxID=86838 RepID=A0AAV5GQU1_9BASI|nr:hypothetical protein Rhopal_004900-T1 [Rhodotorula paludigena]
MPESGRTLGLLLEYFEPTPVQPRELDFPNDWELMAAVKRYSGQIEDCNNASVQVWRGIDAMHAVLNQSPLPPNLVAPAFILSQLFTIPTLAQLAAKAAAKSCTSDADALDALLAGLTCGAGETGLQLEKVMPLITYLLRRSTYLHTLRSRALATLRAFDHEYECEEYCRGMVYSSLSDILSTTSRRRLRKLDYGAGEVDFACKDCDVRWEKVVAVLLEGLADMPEPPVFC